MGLDVEDRLRKLVEQMKVAGYNSHMIRLAKEMANELQQRGIYGIDSFVKNLKDRVNSKQEYLDILKEGRFAIILARNGFSEVTLIKQKQGQRFPDIKTDWNRNTIYFEVTRKRPGEEDKQIQSQAGFVCLKKAGNIAKRIRDKLGQLKIGGINVVVIWSDTIQVLLPNVVEAFKKIQQEISPEECGRISGILFTEAGETCYPTQFELLKNDRASKPIGIRLAKKLESLSGWSPRKLQREMDEMADALRRIQ